MMAYLKRLFRFKAQEIEATLNPAKASNEHGIGVVRVEVWNDGTIRFKASVKNSQLSEGIQLEIFCAGNYISSMVITGGYAKEIINTAIHRSIPEIRNGQSVEFRYHDKVLYAGEFGLERGKAHQSMSTNRSINNGEIHASS